MLGLRRKRTNLHEKYDHPSSKSDSRAAARALVRTPSFMVMYSACRFLRITRPRLIDGRGLDSTDRSTGTPHVE
jgi:hypothetical protein